MAKDYFGFRAPESLKNAVAEKSEKQGTDSSKYAIRWLAESLFLEEDCIKEVESLGVNNLSFMQKVQCLVAKRIGEIKAQLSIYGEVTIDELSTDNDGKPNSFSTICKYSEDRNIKEIEDRIIKRAMRKEEIGDLLSEIEKNVLIKHKIGKTWEKSDERQRELAEDIRKSQVIKDAVNSGIIMLPHIVTDFSMVRAIHDLINLYKEGVISKDSLQKSVNAQFDKARQCILTDIWNLYDVEGDGNNG